MNDDIKTPAVATHPPINATFRIPKRSERMLATGDIIKVKPIKIDIQSLTIDHGQISRENIDVVFMFHLVFIENTCMPKI